MPWAPHFKLVQKQFSPKPLHSHANACVAAPTNIRKGWLWLCPFICNRKTIRQTFEKEEQWAKQLVPWAPTLRHGYTIHDTNTICFFPGYTECSPGLTC